MNDNAPCEQRSPKQRTFDFIYAIAKGITNFLMLVRALGVCFLIWGLIVLLQSDLHFWFYHNNCKLIN